MDWANITEKMGACTAEHFTGGTPRGPDGRLSKMDHFSKDIMYQGRKKRVNLCGKIKIFMMDILKKIYFMGAAYTSGGIKKHIMGCGKKEK